MYFTDKFRRSELKLMHPGLVKESPGRKPPPSYRNATSDDFMFFSKVYSGNYGYHSSVSPPNSDALKQASKLKVEINEISRKMKAIEYTLLEKNRKIASEAGINYGFTANLESTKDYTANLKNQIALHEKAKAIEKKQKELEVKQRLLDLKKLSDQQLTERKNYIEKTSQYKNELETQEGIKKSIEMKQSSLFPALKNPMRSYGSVSNLRDMEVPFNKNNNSLTVSLSKLPEFHQPFYTKNNPKIIRTSPLTGINRS